MKQILWFGLFAAALIGSCRPNEDAQLLPGAWRVLRIQPAGEPSQDAGAEYILRFKTDGTLSLNLDVNQCFGAYSTPGPGRIGISSLGCTEACCDSAFAERLASILTKVTAFEFQGNKLTLSGPDGKVEARRVN